ncbi:MAG: TonB-dependent receptor [Elusimicrobia bacterium]|nr:TonB-dependent receptor [Elusimicrobiota bacterium]
MKFSILKLFLGGFLVATMAAHGLAATVHLSLEYAETWGESIVSSHSLSGEEIEMQNSIQMTGLLEHIPGVFINSTSNAGRFDVNIRGFGDSGRKIGFFIDGIPTKMSIFNCTVTHTFLNSNVDRIDVFRGPDSVLWGSSALGGVVNIITPRPTREFEGHAQLSYGSFNTRNESMFFGSRQDRLSFTVSANRISTDGHLPRSGFEAADYAMRIIYEISPTSEISFAGRYFKGIKHEPILSPDRVLQPIGAPEWNEFERGQVSLTYNNTNIFRNSVMSLKTFYVAGTHLFENFVPPPVGPPGSARWNSRDNTFGVFAHFNTELSENNTLTYGVEFQREEGRIVSSQYTANPTPPPPFSPLNNLGTFKRYHVSAFVSSEHRFTDRLRATAGIRYSHDEISGDFWAPRAAIEYDFSDRVTARAIYSRAFRMPYINELFVLRHANPDLKPEDVTSYEIGIRAGLLDVRHGRLTADISAFVMEGDNIITFAPGPGSTFINGGRYNFSGGELGLWLPLDARGSRIFAGYTHFNAGDHTSGRPGRKIDGVLHYNFSRFQTMLSVMHIGNYHALDYSQRRLRDYTVLNFKANYRINNNFSIFAAANNFTDERYDVFTTSFSQAFIYPMPGATYTVGLRVSF